MQAKIALSAFAATLLACSAAADVTITSWSQDPATRKVTVTYDLTESAIVTMDVCTNGNVSIGGEHIVSLAGDVNREVAAGSGHTILWMADRDWPGHTLPAGDATIVLRAWTKAVPPDYLVVDLRMNNTATCSTLRYYADASAIPGGVTNDVYKTKKLVMRRIPANGVERSCAEAARRSSRSVA